MNRRIYTGFLAVLAFALASCFDDRGNYDYTSPGELEPVRIAGLDERYEALSRERFQLSPVIEGADQSDYDYCWYVYPADGARGVKDTVGVEKDLDFVVSQPSGNYDFVFQARNRRTGVCTWEKMTLVVSSPFSRGWGVTKHENGVTDIDWIKLDGTVVPNVLAAANGEGVAGQALKTAYMAQSYNYEQMNPDGTYTLMENRKVLIVMSRSDMRAYNPENLSLIRRFDEMFVYRPETARPQDILAGYYMGAWAVNDGRISSLNLSVSPNYGKFGYPKMGEYSVADHLFKDPLGMSVVAFDNLSSSFIRVGLNDASVNSFLPFGTMNPNNMNYELVYLRNRRKSAYEANSGFGIMKEKGADKYRSFVVNPMAALTGFNLFTRWDAVPEGVEVGRGRVFGPNLTNDVLYYSPGDNRLRSYNMVNQSENPAVFTFGEGEQVAAIEHINYFEYSDLAYKTSCLAVVTNKDGRWNLYLFNFIGETADIETAEGSYTVSSGTGTATSVFHMGVSTQYVD